ncbi:MAG: Rrf2 family transcriptional regulator [Gammaproteobacteria bacterium]|nr:Rrf2 family transcriptional regulator [Gammaproteobacteria bacterium]
MRLSTKSRYAITAMLDLALNGAEGPVTLADISENQNISLSYLEQLFSGLRAKGLVRGVRGPGGGYYLGRDAAAISIADVICAVDDWVEYTRTHAAHGSSDIQHLGTRGMWEDLSNQIFGFLQDISLHDLVQRASAVSGASADKRAAALLSGLRDHAA